MDKIQRRKEKHQAKQEEKKAKRSNNNNNIKKNKQNRICIKVQTKQQTTMREKDFVSNV